VALAEGEDVMNDLDLCDEHFRWNAEQPDGPEQLRGVGQALGRTVVNPASESVECVQLAREEIIVAQQV
jgi:hypothetical protein